MKVSALLQRKTDLYHKEEKKLILKLSNRYKDHLKESFRSMNGIFIVRTKDFFLNPNVSELPAFPPLGISEDIYLYHGTSVENFKKMIKDGIKIEFLSSVNEDYGKKFVWFGLESTNKEKRYGCILLKIQLKIILQALSYKEFYAYELGTRYYQKEHSQVILLDKNKQEILLSFNDDERIVSPVDFKEFKQWPKMSTPKKADDWLHREIVFMEDFSVLIKNVEITFEGSHLNTTCVPSIKRYCSDCAEKEFFGEKKAHSTLNDVFKELEQKNSFV